MSLQWANKPRGWGTTRVADLFFWPWRIENNAHWWWSPRRAVNVTQSPWRAAEGRLRAVIWEDSLRVGRFVMTFSKYFLNSSTLLMFYFYRRWMRICSNKTKKQVYHQQVLLTFYWSLVYNVFIITNTLIYSFSDFQQSAGGYLYG